MEEIKRVALVGGPCSGKTTMKSHLREKLSDCGVSVTFVPEVASWVMSEWGLSPALLNKDQYFRFEELILETQIDWEDKALRAAQIKGGDRKVVITDRGCMDVAAYISPEEFKALMEKHSWKRAMLCDSRYDAILHLVTAADRKEEFYNLDNKMRTESPEQARVLDEKIKNAYTGHPHVIVIDNSTLFEEKKQRVLKAVQRAIGIPVALEIERKFLVQEPIVSADVSGVNLKIPVHAQWSYVEQAYLKKTNGERIRIRKRGQEKDGFVYYETKKIPTNSPLTRIEIERHITPEEYSQKMKECDPKFDVLKKIRTCFLWNNQYFELDYFLEPARLYGRTFLEIELTEENDAVHIPDWLGKVTDVSEDSACKNKNLARRP